MKTSLIETCVSSSIERYIKLKRALGRKFYTEYRVMESSTESFDTHDTAWPYAGRAQLLFIPPTNRAPLLRPGCQFVSSVKRARSAAYLLRHADHAAA
jgi:hypothetical protein